jgi:hypothetical protein
MRKTDVDLTGRRGEVVGTGVKARTRKWQRELLKLAKTELMEEFGLVNAVESCHGYRARSKDWWYRLVNILEWTQGFLERDQIQ